MQEGLDDPGPPRAEPMTDGAALTSPAVARQVAAAPWYAGMTQFLSSYLPLLLMCLLALGSWWLVKNTPVSDAERAAAPARHEPDYTMQGFVVQRFDAGGALRVQIEGDTLRHYPDTDTLEIDNARIRFAGQDGRLTVASARHAVANSDGSEVQLSGGANVLREATAQDEAIEFRGEFLHAFVNVERVRSHLPVTVLRGSSEVHAGAMDYDNLTRVLLLKGRIRAVFSPPTGGGGE
jgi:lipopolysaccharide export system protein LptC